jgi:hypothetical protein
MPDEITHHEAAAQAEGAAAAVVATGQGSDDPGAQVERFAVAFAPASASDDNRTIDAVWYTGAKVPRLDWRTGEEYDLILDMNACRMDRLNNGGPVLDSHMPFGVDSQLGVVRRAWAENSTGLATIQFSKRDAVTPIWNDVKGGIIQNLSPGMWIYKKVDTTPKGQDRREFTATDWEPFEISLVSVPADAATNFMSAAGTPPASPSSVKTQRASAQKETPVDPISQAAGADARQDEAVLAAARDEGAKAEHLRAKTIRTMVAPFRFEEQFVSGLIDEGLSVETARERAMAKLAAQFTDYPTDPTNTSVTMGADANDKRREAMGAVLLHRLNPTKFKDDTANEYRFMRPSEMAKECLNHAGIKTRGMSPMQWATHAMQAPPATFIGQVSMETLGAMSTTDFPYILANVNSKYMLAAYAEVESRWKELSRQRNATDFKTQYPTLVSGAETFELIPESGEYKFGAFAESRESYAVKTYGKVYAFTRQMLINDDMNVFSDISFAQGQAAARTEANLWWALVTANAQMADGQNVFSAAHNNLINPGTAISNDSLTVARATIAKQTGMKGEDLNLVPVFLVVPPDKLGLARSFTTPVQATEGGKINLWTDLTPLTENRLGRSSTVAWYLACAGASNPPSIVHAYIDGQEGVYQESRVGFNPDGIEFKARIDFGCAWVSHRGWVKNNGA